MRVRGEAGTRRHAVFVEDAQGAELLELWGVVLREGEGVVAVEPAVVGVTPGGGAAGGYFHGCDGVGSGGNNGLGDYVCSCFGGDGHVELIFLLWGSWIGLVWFDSSSKGGFVYTCLSLWAFSCGFLMGGKDSTEMRNNSYIHVQLKIYLAASKNLRVG